MIINIVKIFLSVFSLSRANIKKDVNDIASRIQEIKTNIFFIQIHNDNGNIRAVFKRLERLLFQRKHKNSKNREELDSSIKSNFEALKNRIKSRIRLMDSEIQTESFRLIPQTDAQLLPNGWNGNTMVSNFSESRKRLLRMIAC